MTDKKISELTQITGADVDDANDELAIVDASASETKAITRGELMSSVSSMSITGDFTVDTDTLFVDASANRVGIGTSSPGSALQVEGQITGTAVTQSPTDSTAGRLMQTGDGGLLETGDPPLLDDWDRTDWPSGLYKVGTSPDGDHPGGAGTALISRWSNSQQTQLYIQHFPGANRGQIWTRVYQNNEWTAWRKSYDTGNAVGTVSQSGGTPTGAIIERGSNANGEYVKFADGTMICTLVVQYTGIDITTAAGALYTNATLPTWTFPASFSSTSSLNVTASPRISGNILCRGRVTSLTTADIKFFSTASSAATDIFVEHIAIGHWY